MNAKILLIVITVSIIFSLPFLNSGYFKTSDGEWAIIRLAEMKREISDLQIPPRWSDFLNHGYGYPLFLFTYPLPYYTGVILLTTGMSLTSAIKTIFVLSSILGALGMYLFSRRFWGEIGGLISSIFYITVPYRLINLYVRGSIGETLALAIVPWLFLAFEDINSTKKAKFFAVILLSSLIISHNVGALLFTITFILYFFSFNRNNKKKLFAGMYAIIFSLLISSYFWLPLLIENQYIFAGNNEIADRSLHFVTLNNLVVQSLESAIKPPIFVGYLHLLILFFALGLVFLVKKIQNRFTIVFFLLTSLISFILMFPQSEIVWKLPIIGMIDFPWRLMLLVCFSLSFLAGSITLISYGKNIAIILAILAIIIYFPIVSVKNTIYYPDSYYETNDATTTSNNELMPIWVLTKPTNKPYSKVILKGSIKNIVYNSKQIFFNADSSRAQNIIINTVYFPGWVFNVNGVKVTTSITSPQGLIQISIPQGQVNVYGYFTGTPIRKLSDIISIVSLVYFIALFSKQIFKLKKQ